MKRKPKSKKKVPKKEGSKENPMEGAKRFWGIRTVERSRCCNKPWELVRLNNGVERLFCSECYGLSRGCVVESQ